MATIKIGRVRLVDEGVFDVNRPTPYEALSVVKYLGGVYWSTREVPLGVLPTNTTYWSCFYREGQIGKSAYQSWLDVGNVGTEAEFVASLVAKSNYDLAVENGFTGSLADYLTAQSGKSLYDDAVDRGAFTGTFEEFLATLKGADGLDGRDGTDGIDGHLPLTDSLIANDPAVAASARAVFLLNQKIVEIANSFNSSGVTQVQLNELLGALGITRDANTQNLVIPSHLQIELSNSVVSNSTTTAASSFAVRVAYNKALEAYNKAMEAIELYNTLH